MTANQPILCFDLDGPILDVSERYYQLYLDLLAELTGNAAGQIAPLPKGEYWHLKRANISEAEILRASGITDHDLACRYSELRLARLELSEYLGLDKPWPGIAEGLRAAGRKFVVIAATLRSSRWRLLAQLDALSLADVFAAVVSAPLRGEERGKTKAALVGDLCANRQGWFVGDTETDIIAGKELGWQTAAVSFGIRDETTLAAAQPDLMLSSPQQLIDWLGGLAPAEGTKGN